MGGQLTMTREQTGENDTDSIMRRIKRAKEAGELTVSAPSGHKNAPHVSRTSKSKDN